MLSNTPSGALGDLAMAARDIDAAETVDSVAQQSVEFVATYIGGCAAASITFAGRESFESLAESDSLALRADQLQAELGEGPSLDAVVETPTVYAADLAHDPRWPLWAGSVVHDLGVRSIVSYRLFTSDETIGALNLYGKDVDAFDDEARELGYLAATQIAVVISSTRKEQSFRSALATRVAIGQAQGMLMERFGLSADQAFNVLRRASTSHDVPLREIADELIRTRELPADVE